MTKANLKANILRFVVPSEMVKERVKRRVDGWKASLSDKKASMTVSIGTIAELESKVMVWRYDNMKGLIELLYYSLLNGFFYIVDI